MLDELAVANLGIIAAARLEPGPGLIVVTGETGAGKTLLLGALRLLSGERASGDLPGAAGDEARIEARFLTEDGEVVASRRLVDGGRSRAYLDGEMVPLRALQDRIGGLVEIVAQHDRLTLTRPAELRRLIDAALDEEGQRASAEYEQSWSRLQALRADRDAVGGDQRALNRELDLMRYQADEIAAAGFTPGEEDELRAEAVRLRNGSAIAEELAAAGANIDGDRGAGETLERALDHLRRAARLDPALADLVATADAATDAAREVSAGMAKAAAELDADPRRLEAVEERLARAGSLKRKYGATIDEVIAFGTEAARRAAEIETLLERAGSLDAEVQDAAALVATAGTRLRAAREMAADRTARSAVAHLLDLGFRDPVVEVVVTPADPGPAGADRLELQFTSDATLPPGPVARVASGGELSRLVLAVRLAGGAGEAPVVVFDEVDAGIGGATALAVGRKLQALAAGRQVLCVTHLPQVAAFADGHFVVTRSGAVAAVERVEGTARLEELTRMLSGLPDSERGREHAEELLAIAAVQP